MPRAHEIHRARAPIYTLARGIDAAHCGCGDGAVLSWRPSDPERIMLSAQLPGPVFATCVLNDRTLAVGTDAGELFVIDLHERSAEQRIEAHKAAIHAIAALSPDRMVTAGADGHLRTWIREDRRWTTERDLALSDGKLRGLAFSAEKGMIAVACGDGLVRVLETQLLNEACTFTGHVGGASAVAFHPVKPVLLSGGKDGFLRAWPLAGTADELLSMPAHRSAIYAIAFGGAGTRFVTASRDKTMKLWDAQGLDVAERLDARGGGHAHSVNAACWLGNSVISGGDDRRLLCWDQNG